MTTGESVPAQVALGDAVRELRTRRRYSQEELGHHAGLHRNYVGAIERGEINPTFRVLLKLVVGLRVALSELALVYERNVTEPAMNERPRTRRHRSTPEP